MKPNNVDGPSLVLQNRDLMATSNQDMISCALPRFLRHKSLWLSPKNVLLTSLPANSSISSSAERKITRALIDAETTKAMLYINSRKPLSVFYNITSLCLPCLSIGLVEIWASSKSNQMTNE